MAEDLEKLPANPEDYAGQGGDLENTLLRLMQGNANRLNTIQTPMPQQTMTPQEYIQMLLSQGGGGGGPLDLTGLYRR